MAQLLTVSAVGSVLVVCLIAVLLGLVIYSPIDPVELELPVPLPPPTHYKKNGLQSVIKAGEGLIDGAEDVCVDKSGAVYAPSRDGWIRKMHPNGSWENWKMVGSSTMLGLTVSRDDGHLLIADATLSDSFDICDSFADEVIEASDGTAYFSDPSTKFWLHDWFLDVLEAKPNGRLLKYDPSTKKTSVLIDRLAFANGVALSPTEDFLIVCETWRFQCLKYWLKGELEGKQEVFVDNLPGGPDNIHLAADGTYWIALLPLRFEGLLDFIIHRSPIVKRVIAGFPKLVDAISSLNKATVANVGPDGKIRKMYDDSDGSVMTFLTSALEFDGHLYLGSLRTNFVGKLPLN
ncbi:hypothetical protein ACLOJK_001039 [Asimina triloba]